MFFQKNLEVRYLFFYQKNLWTNPISVGISLNIINELRTMRTHNCSPDFEYYLFIEWVKHMWPPK